LIFFTKIGFYGWKLKHVARSLGLKSSDIFNTVLTAFPKVGAIIGFKN